MSTAGSPGPGSTAADPPVTVAGRTLPADLPALLTAGPGPDGREVEGLRIPGRAPIPWLMSYGVADTATLLTIPADRWRLTGARDAAPIASLRAFLRARWGVELGALAEPEAPRGPKPPTPAAPPDPVGPFSWDEPKTWPRTIDPLNPATWPSAAFDAPLPFNAPNMRRALREFLARGAS